MGMQGYGSMPGRRTAVASSAPSRRPPKPTPLIGTAMRAKPPSKPKGK